MNRKYRITAALLALVVAVSVTALAAPVAAQSVDDVTVDLSDTDGDGLDDSVEVQADISNGGSYNPAAVVEFNGEGDLNLSDTDLTQADPGVSQINDDQPNENVTFGSTAVTGAGINGTYTVLGDLSGQSAGDSIDVAVWTGNPNRADADDEMTASATVSQTQQPTQSDLSITGIESSNDAPPAGSNITITATVENTGSSSLSGDVTLGQDTTGDGSLDTTVAGPVSTGNINAGGTATVEFDVNTNDFTGDTVTYGVSLQDSAGASATQTAPQQLVVGGIQQPGSITVNVQNRDAEAIENADVELYTDAGFQSGANPIRVQTTGPNGIVTFDNLAAGSSQTNSVDYVIRSEAPPQFASGTDEVQLYTPNQLGPTRTLTLSSALDAEELGVAVWDSENERIAGDTGYLLADNRSDNTVEFVVYSQNQLDNPLNSNLNVQVDFAGGLGSAAAPTTIGDFIDNGAINKTETFTIQSNGPSGNIDGDASTGDWSYTVFEVTADDASEDDIQALESQGLDPIVTEGIDATATNSSGSLLQDDANATYFRKGDKSVSGEVSDVDGENFSDANVWVAYGHGGPAFDLEDAQNIQDASGNAFLTTESDDEGQYTINGIAGDNTPYTVYAEYPGFNSVNLTTAPIAQTVAAAEEKTTERDPLRTQTENLVLQEAVQEYRFDITAEEFVNETVQGDFVKEASVPVDGTIDVRINVTSAVEDTSDFGPAPAGTNVEVGITNANYGVLGSQEVETDENGVATTTFEGLQDIGGTIPEVNVTAKVFNAEGTEYGTNNSDVGTFGSNIAQASVPPLQPDVSEARIDVFDTGILTGQIRDEEEVPVPGANVTLSVQNTSPTDQSFEVVEDPGIVNPKNLDDETSEYVFQNLRAGRTYRVDAEIQNGTVDGFAERPNLQPGTNTRDIVLENFTVDDGGNNGGNGGPISSGNPFSDSGGNAVSQGDAADVLFDWNQDGEVDGETYMESEMADFLFEWNQA